MFISVCTLRRYDVKYSVRTLTGLKEQCIYTFILLPAGTSIVLPVGYMDQPTGLLHISLWRRLCGRKGRRLFR